MAHESPPWHAAFPTPRIAAPFVKKELIQRIMLNIGDFLNGGPLFIDVRRTDYEGGKIRGSLNIPAQSFFMNMAVLYKLCRDADVERIIFYCGSSNGRGPRCAGWFADYVKNRADEENTSERPEALVLEGGIKGWVNAGPEYQQLVDGFEPEYWKQFAPEAGKEENSEEKRAAEQVVTDEAESGAGPSKKRKESST